MYVYIVYIQPNATLPSPPLKKKVREQAGKMKVDCLVWW